MYHVNQKLLRISSQLKLVRKSNPPVLAFLANPGKSAEIWAKPTVEGRLFATSSQWGGGRSGAAAPSPPAHPPRALHPYYTDLDLATRLYSYQPISPLYDTI